MTATMSTAPAIVAAAAAGEDVGNPILNISIFVIFVLVMPIIIFNVIQMRKDA